MSNKISPVNINLHNIENEEQALILASKDLITFGKLFLPDDFLRSETPVFHYEIADIIDNKENKMVAIIIPRGHGKTILTKAGILKDFLFDKEDLFYGWVSATKKLSTGNMDYIKYHLQYNEKIGYYFGNLRGNKWTEEDIEINSFDNPLGYRCGFRKLLSKSNVAGIRGGAKLHKRYDAILLDDFEDENNTITKEARQRNANLVTAVVYPALEPHNGRLRINGTPVHYDSFINNLISNSQKAEEEEKSFEWKVFLRKAYDRFGEPLWPSFFTKEILEQKRKFYHDSGTPSKFYQEYMMEVQSEEDSLFRREQIRYHDALYLHENGINFLIINGERVLVLTFLACDPATDIDTKDSDFSVIMVIAMDARNNIYVLEYVRHRSIPTIGYKTKDGNIEKLGVVDYIFNLYNKYHCSMGIVEDVAMNRSIFQSLNAKKIENNRFDIAIKPVKPGGRDKRNRIYTILSSKFALGTVYLRDSQYDLIDEIITFGPRMAHDDTIETLAYAASCSYPPSMDIIEKDGTWSVQLPKVKSWITS